jgi:hypothetical protein
MKKACSKKTKKKKTKTKTKAKNHKTTNLFSNRAYTQRAIRNDEDWRRALSYICAWEKFTEKI